MAYFDPNFHSLEEYIVPSPPTVSVDNDTYQDHTVVKVDGPNRHGILVDVLEALADLDLIISKSNISADGEWIMHAFHVTDELGNKMTDPAHIRYIKQSLMFAESRRGGGGESSRRPPDEVRTCLNKLLGAGHHHHLSSEHTVVEMTVADHPGLLSEVLATLLDFSFHINSAVAWAHNGRAAFIFYGPMSLPPTGLTELKEQLTRVVEAHCIEKWQLGISGPLPADRAHTSVCAERRLHQIMQEDNDWEGMASRTDHDPPLSSEAVVTAVEMELSEKHHNYMVEVIVRSRDRPKLVFDVVCTLADLNYDVVHASVSMEESIAVQEYYIKKIRNGNWSRVTEMEKEKLVECLMAAIERRPGPWWMRVEVRVLEYRDSLLWEITRVLRENGMLVVGAKWDNMGELAAGVFYVKGGSSRGNVARSLIHSLRNEIGGCCDFEIKESNN
ncbi:hypothetical protein M5K25_005809 [Dendrobium thyrsiflorum]|uniref:ACT domain-containing protein ACR n=1 Tax=Dendrobium thyrsiflorum TaxID=117978 RepID=A0ABD0VJH4_DENTH